jgi:hypothetical protein
MHFSLANERVAAHGNQEMALRRISLGPEAGFLYCNPRFDPKAVSVAYGVSYHAKPLVQKERSSFFGTQITSYVFVCTMFQLQTRIVVHNDVL